MKSWLEFWNLPHSIYVCDAHKREHYRQIAKDVLAVLPPSTKTLLDWGCGEALGTHDLLTRGISVFLFDKATACQRQLAERFQGEASVKILCDQSVREIERESLDAVMVSSVLQYISQEEFAILLLELCRMLKRGGVLIISDVIRPKAGLFVDVWPLLKLGYQHRFLHHVVTGLIRTFLSPYRTLRRSIGLTTYKDETLLAMLAKCGFLGRRASKNIGCNPYRTTYLAEKL